MSLERHLADAQAVLGSLRAQAPAIEAIAALVVSGLKDGRKVLACGNGGSAAQAQHFVTELVGRYKRARPSLPALCLAGDATSLSCLANDFTWERALARALEGLGAPGDVLVCFSTSGRSENILRALDAARPIQVRTVALLGAGGGAARGRADLEVIVDSADTARIQEAHLFLVHSICEAVEDAYAPV